MPIEFRCSRCGRLLRTPDDSAGRQAKCPECGNVQQVPEVSTPPLPAPPPVAPTGEAGSPFAAAAPPGPSQEPSANPYQSPQFDGGTAAPAAYYPDYAAARVQAPAITLIAVGALGATFVVIRLVLAVIGLLLIIPQQNLPVGPLPVVAQIAIELGLWVVLLLVESLVIYGATRMQKLEGYSWAMTAAVIAVIPCLSPCCVLGIPVGIWALVVLLDDHVKAAFRG